MQIAAEEFDEKVLRSPLPLLLLIGASQCVDSQNLLRLFEALTPPYRGRVMAATANMDKSPELARRLGVLSAPAVLLIRNGEVHFQFTGQMTERELTGLLERAALNGASVFM